MALPLSDSLRTEIELALEAGKPATLIAAETRVSPATIARIRAELQALRAKNDLPPLLVQRPGRQSSPFTDEERAIRAEYVETGAIRPLARKFGMTVDRIRYVIARPPSLNVERAAKQATGEESKQNPED